MSEKRLLFETEIKKETKYFEGICISQTTGDRAKVYVEDPTYFCRFLGGPRDLSFL
jgi:hypothetical protein